METDDTKKVESQDTKQNEQNASSNSSNDEEKFSAKGRIYSYLIWFLFAVLTVFISGGVWWLTFTVMSKTSWTFSWLPATCGWATLLTIFGYALYRGWNQVPQMHEWIIEIFGNYYGVPLKAGLHIIFPHFNFVTIRSKVYMGEQLMTLYLDERIEEGFGGGDVEFLDASAPVVAKVFFVIKDACWATYKIVDLFKGVEEKIDASLRSYLGKYTIDQATVLKVHFDLLIILNGIKLELDETTNEPTMSKEEIARKIEERTAESTTVKETIESWGTKIESVLITDIVLSEEIKTLRRKVLEATKNKEASREEAEQIVILATAEKDAAFERGEGRKAELSLISQSGISPAEASDLVKKLSLYEQLPDKTLVIESGQGVAGLGAAFGAGANHSQEMTDSKKEKK